MYPRLELVLDLVAELDRDEWQDDRALTGAEEALIELRFRVSEANAHASVPWEEAKTGSWLRSSAHYKLSQVRRARSNAATSAGRKTPNCRRIKSFEMVATARLRKDGCSNPASRQNAK